MHVFQSVSPITGSKSWRRKRKCVVATNWRFAVSGDASTRARRHSSQRCATAWIVTSHATRVSIGRQKLVDRAKLLLSSDPARRWTLGDIGAAIGVSPVYLTQVFQQVEGMPLYRYQLRLRLARALNLLGRYEDLTTLSMDLGFSSHSHFSSAFRQTYGRTPAEFQRSVRLR
jgi:AraC-like DNA-binding protein